MAWPLKGAIRPLTGYRGPGFAILVSLDEVDLVVRSVSIVMMLNWATVLRGVPAAKPTASASANVIMP
jgi:hypothetical protein